MNIGDEVTINGTIVFVCSRYVIIETKKGGKYKIEVNDINTIRPKIVVPDKDERRGN